MADKRTYQLTAQATPTETLKLGVDDATFTEEKNITIEELNQATRSGAGLQSDGSYDTPSGSNYLDAATDQHDADLKLDAALKAVSDDVNTNVNDISTLNGEMDQRILRAAVTVSSNDLLNDLTSGIQLIPKVSGKVIDVISVIAKLTYNSAAYNVPAPVYIRTNNSLMPIAQIPELLFTTAKDSIYKGEMQTDMDLIVGESLLLHSTSNISGGNSPITIYLTYRYINL